VTVDEILYGQEGIIVGLEIARAHATGLQGEQLQSLLEAEQAAYRKMKVVNNYEPTSRASWRNSPRFFTRTLEASTDAVLPSESVKASVPLLSAFVV
jgi:hypothetical protein